MRPVEPLLWFPTEELIEQEQAIAQRAAKKRQLFVFLREQRQVIFDEAFQRELIEMYRQTGAGKVPLAPARVALLTLLQRYADVAEQTTAERRMIVSCDAYLTQKTGMRPGVGVLGSSGTPTPVCGGRRAQRSGE